MNFKQHLKYGAVSSVAVGIGTYYMVRDPIFASASALVTLSGSLASDIDCASVPSRIFAFIGIALAGIFMYTGNDKYAAIVGIVYMAFSVDKHRGITHSILLIIGCFLGGVLALLNYINPGFYFLMPASVGFLTHRIVDRK